MAACTPSAETRHGASLSDDAIQETHHGAALPNDGVRETQNLASLQAIDSLMWRRPDSALMVMQVFAGSTEADSLDVFEGHYCQVLISELLYKNDCGQSNRAELLQAVGYFDSIVGTDGADARGASPQRGASLRERDAFLDARAHYINGVGFYEQGGVIDACAEYLKVLEVMEERFEEKEMVKNKAKFMAYTYNRLGDMFSGQFMMENAISCYEKSLVFCKIEPISSQSVSNMFFLIGKQYDKMNEIDKARLCYEQALGEMKNCDNLLYRDVFFCKTVCDYQVGMGLDETMDELRQVVVQADDEKERLNRFLTIGAIFNEEGIYDSSLYYFDFVFQYEKDMIAKMRAAESMRSIYDKLGDKEKYDECLHFLASQKKTDGENKALVSKLDNLFQDYLKQKQEKLTEAEHTKHIRKIVGIIVPIAVLMALAIIVVAKLRSRKLLQQQQEEADRVLDETEQAHEEELRRLQTETKQRLEEAEKKHQQKVAEMGRQYAEELRLQKDHTEKEIEQIRQRHEAELEAERLAYQKEQDALRQSLRQQEDQMKALEKSLGRQQGEEEVWRRDFLKEPICKRINELLRGKRITTRDTSFKHGDILLQEEDYKQFGEAVERHFEGFDAVLLSRCPGLRHDDLALCHLHLMGLGEGEIAALKSRTYSGIKKQDESVKRKLLLEESVSEYVSRVAKELANYSKKTFEGSIMNEAQGISQKNSQKNSQKIVELIKKRPEITTTEMAELIGVSRRTIVNITNKLQDEGIIRRVGPDKGGHWEVIE